MRIRHDDMIEFCQAAELKRYQIHFLTVDDKVFITNFVSISDADDAFNELLTKGYLRVSNFCQKI